MILTSIHPDPIGDNHLAILQIHHPDFVCLEANVHSVDLRRSILHLNLIVNLNFRHLDVSASIQNMINASNYVKVSNLSL